MPKITYVIGDDWEGVYLDGKLKAEGHHVTLREFVELLGLEFETVEADDVWLDNMASLPEDLNDVMW